MYELTSGAVALAQQLRNKARGLPVFQTKEWQKRGRVLRTRADAALITEAGRKTEAALGLVNERGRKRTQAFNEKMEYVVEEQEAQRREKILQRLELQGG